MAATAPSKLTFTALSTLPSASQHHHHRLHPALLAATSAAKPLSLYKPINSISRRLCISCQATDVSSSSVQAEETSPAVSKTDENWVPVVPLAALPKGERRVIIQGGETILLLWFKDEVFAIENRSPAEGAYSEGLLNAKLTQVIVFFTTNFHCPACHALLMLLI